MSGDEPSGVAAVTTAPSALRKKACSACAMGPREPDATRGAPSNRGAERWSCVDAIGLEMWFRPTFQNG
jgi:hypothetical protein